MSTRPSLRSTPSSDPTGQRCDEGGSDCERLRGRDQEIGFLDRLIDKGESPRGGVLIVGEPGIGKSSLWAHGVETARRIGLRVLATTCIEAEAGMPYAALDALFADLLDQEGDRLPAPQRNALDAAFLRRSTGTAAEPRTVAAGVVTLLQRASEASSVLVAVDDLHWVDRETRTCLAYAARRLADRQLVLMMTARNRSPLWSPPRDPTKEELLAIMGSRPTSVELGPLPDAAIEAMLSDQLANSFSRAECRRLAAETGGNPLWALEIARSQCPGHDQGRDPRSVVELVAERLDGLDEDTVALSCLVAALGRPQLTTVLGAVGSATEPGDRTELTLEAATNAGLVAVVGERLAPPHPLIGTALLTSLPPFRLRHLRRLAAELAESVEARALHLLQSFGDGRPDQLGSSSQRSELLAALDAASAAAHHRGAPGAAARFAQDALALLEGLGDGATTQESRRRVLAAELHYQADNLDSVLVLLAGVDLCTLDPDLLERAGPLLAQTTNEQRGAAAARVVVDTIDGLLHERRSTDAARRCRALVSTLRSDLQCGATGDRVEVARLAVELTRASPTSPSLRRRALGSLVYALDHAGVSSTDAVEELRAMGVVGPLECTAWADSEVAYGMSRWSASDLAGATEVFSAALHRHTVRGDGPGVVQAGDMLAYVQLLRGRPDAAEKTLGLLDDQLDRPPAGLTYVVNSRGLLHLVRGEHAALETLLDEQAASGPRSVRALGLAAHLRGLLALQHDDPERAVQHLARFVTLSREHGVQDPLRRLDADVPLAEALIAIGEHSRAARIVEALDLFATRTSRSLTRGQAVRTRAVLVARQDHDLNRALELARNATIILEHGVVPAEYGRSLAWLAEIHRLRGEPQAAAEHRQRAHRVFSDIGYRWWAHQTSHAGNVNALSPSECKVASVVAGGSSNRDAATSLHISVRTVENHLARIYRKLGIHSRAELAAHGF